MSTQSIFKNNKKRDFVYIPSILFVGLGIRFYYFPHDLPLVIDALSYFTHSTETVFLGRLPTEEVPANNGWPLFLSFWFQIINLENTMQYMQLQRIISLSLSSLTAIPIFFLCKKFFSEKLAVVGAALFIFDPRIILNSLLGITEPLFILLSTTALVTFLKYERKYIIIAILLSGICTIIRSEGLFIFITLTVLFFIKYKISKEVVKTYLPGLILFALILIPVIDYRIDTTGTDSIFLRAAQGTSQTISNENGIAKFYNGIELFGKYLGWIMIPTFIVFLPFGVIQFLRKRSENTNFVFIFLVISSIPILYAYFVQAKDTRYLYVLYPIFCLLSLYAIQSYVMKIKKKNIALLIILIGILASSIVFYEYKENDYEKEREYYEIGKIVINIVDGVNSHPTESRYIRAAQIPEQWPFVFHDDMYKVKVISTKGYEDLSEYIQNSKTELTHIIVDSNTELPDFLKDVNENYEKYSYLNKIFDSHENGFKHDLKILKIDYEKFEIELKN